MEEIKFALDTFYAVMAGALVMWMAAILKFRKR